MHKNGKKREKIFISGENNMNNAQWNVPFKKSLKCLQPTNQGSHRPLLGFAPIMCPRLACSLSWSSRLCCGGTDRGATWNSGNHSRPYCSPRPSHKGGLGRWMNSQNQPHTALLLSWLTGDPPSSPAIPKHHETAWWVNGAGFFL